MNPLQTALTVADYHERQAAIMRELQVVAGSESGVANLTWLIEAVTHLNGLPANSIDALRLLPSCPETGIALLINAPDADRPAVWSLQDDLPFLWLALPAGIWQRAVSAHGSALFAALAGPFGTEAAATMAREQVDRLRGQLIALEPVLAATCGGPEQQQKMIETLPPLNALASSYIGAQDDRNREDRNETGDRLASLGIKLPSELSSKAHSMFAGLFAPVLLAAAAAGKLRLSREDALLIRRVLREDPAYVAPAWAHLLKFYGAFRQ